MKTVIQHKDGSIDVPDEYNELSRLHIRGAWQSQVITRKEEWKGHYRYCYQTWYRSKKNGDKPYIPEGFIEFNGERFKIVEAK